MNDRSEKEASTKAILKNQRSQLANYNFSAWHPNDVFKFVEQAGLNHQGDSYERGWAKKAILENKNIWKALTPDQAVYVIEHLQFDQDMIEKARYAYREKPIYGSSALDHFLKEKPDLEALYKAKREACKPHFLNRLWNGYNLSIPRPSSLKASMDEKRPSPSFDEKRSIYSVKREGSVKQTLHRSFSSRTKI